METVSREMMETMLHAGFPIGRNLFAQVKFAVPHRSHVSFRKTFTIPFRFALLHVADQQKQSVLLLRPFNGDSSI